MKSCKECGSYAINHHCHGRDGSDGELIAMCATGASELVDLK